MLKTLRHTYEGLGFWLICRIFESLSARGASNFGGWLGRTLGPRFPVQRVGQKNLQTIYPALSKGDRDALLVKVWDHWGRVAAEYCHIPFLKAHSQIIIEGQEVVQQLRNDQKPAILFTGHLGNFQMITLAAEQLGLPLVQFYRHANNPWVDKGMRRYQEQAAKKILTKGEHGTLGMMRALKQGEHVFVLVDQKFPEGLALPFLGQTAYTSPAVARFAQRFDCPLVPVRCQRLEDPLSFKITFYPPLDICQTERDIMAEVNQHLSQWVDSYPEQWFWIHKRWPFSAS